MDPSSFIPGLPLESAAIPDRGWDRRSPDEREGKVIYFGTYALCIFDIRYS